MVLPEIDNSDVVFCDTCRYCTERKGQYKCLVKQKTINFYDRKCRSYEEYNPTKKHIEDVI